MRIALVTPVAPDSTRGNGVTARRWAQILSELGHEVQVCNRSLGGVEAEVAVVLHARKGAGAMAEAQELGIPTILALTGTDLYGDLPDDAIALASCRMAWRLVVLQELAREQLPEELHPQIRVIHQSMPRPLRVPTASNPGVLRVVCLAHLREVKQPLLPGRALALLDADAGIFVELAGELLEPELELPMRQLSAAEPRFVWLGALAKADAQGLLDRAQVLVVASRMEGGANVISEAAVRSLPILCSDIPGNVGLLGADHPGLFPVGDAQALAALYQRLLDEPGFLSELQARSEAIAPLFDPAREQAAWADLLAEL